MEGLFSKELLLYAAAQGYNSHSSSLVFLS